MVGGTFSCAFAVEGYGDEDDCDGDAMAMAMSMEMREQRHCPRRDCERDDMHSVAVMPSRSLSIHLCRPPRPL